MTTIHEGYPRQKYDVASFPKDGNVQRWVLGPMRRRLPTNVSDEKPKNVNVNSIR